MRRKIITVEDHFQIKGLGLIIVGKTPKNSAIVNVGDSVIIVLPGGQEIEAQISGIPLTCPPNFELTDLVISDLTKEDVPIGSEVFLIE